MKAIYLLAAMVIIVILASFNLNNSSHSRQGYEDSLDADRKKWMDEVFQSIKGKEKWPADSVFKNIRIMKEKNNLSAEHLLWMMNYGWSKELGITCSYCHVKGKWESDSLPTKDIARGMYKMRQQINGEILPGITGKDYTKNPKVTCITCHRGEPVPSAH
jgi:hypothetical protein